VAAGVVVVDVEVAEKVSVWLTDGGSRTWAVSELLAEPQPAIAPAASSAQASM